ncbi:MAG: FecR domain-containing protein [Gammaproteobacteria bacterium]|nr:FecR domain-containing protein [Gammaproteobacteria bacterium]
MSRRRELLAAEAAQWLAALEGADAARREQFAQWLRASPEHVREFLAAAAVWDSLPGVSAQPSAEALVRLASRSDNVVALEGAHPGAANPRAKRLGRWRWGWAAATAAAAALALAAALRLLAPVAAPPAMDYATEVGEQLSVSLADGSMITLNTRSALRVAYSEARRDVYMGGGEALFEVAEDSARPFRVFADSALIEAVGTRFNVRKRPGEVAVTVLEGAVDVSPGRSGANAAAIQPPPAVRVVADQQARAAAGKVVLVDRDASAVIAWRERRLVFDALPVRDVLAEFDRYQAQPVVIADPAIAALPISGVFRSDDRESFLQFLDQMGIAEHSRRPDGVILLSAMERR